MANFNDRVYPWPSVPHDGANAETGGNTRLLFAEQDDYRTRKGAAGGGTDSTGTSLEFTTALSASLFRGVSTTNPTSPMNQQYYYNNGSSNSGFRRYNGTTWEAVTLLSSFSTSMNKIVHIISNSTLATSALAAAQVPSDATIPNSDDEYYIYYNGTNVQYMTVFAAGESASGAGDIFYVIPRIVSADIAETTENIPIEFLKGSLSANKAQAGPQIYGNGFSIAASEEGLHLFLRTLCGSRKDNIRVVSSGASSVTHVSGSFTSVHTTGQAFGTAVAAGSIVKLKVTPAALGTDDIVDIQFDGFDHEGTSIREIMRLTSNMNGKAVETDFYFDGSKGAVTYMVVKKGGAGTFTVTSQNTSTEITFEQPSHTDNQDLLPGWTIEVRKGTIPFTYVGVLPNEASIALARDTALQLDITTIAFDSLPYTDMEGNEVDVGTGKGSRGVSINNKMGNGGHRFVDASETLFTGWQCSLDVTEPGTGTPVRVPLTDATFSINHQLDQAPLIVGDRRPGPPFRSTLRDVMLDGTMLFTRERDWVALFRNNTDFKNPVVVLRNAPAGGFPYELRIELGLGQLMTSPDPQVGDLGLITQAFNMKFRESESGVSDDFKFTVITDKWPASTTTTVGGLRVDGAYA